MKQSSSINYFTTLLFCLIVAMSLPSCKKMMMKPMLDFEANFDSTGEWVLTETSGDPTGQMGEVEATINGGSLFLNSRQETICTTAMAELQLNLENIRAEDGIRCLVLEMEYDVTGSANETPLFDLYISGKRFRFRPTATTDTKLKFKWDKDSHKTKLNGKKVEGTDDILEFIDDVASDPRIIIAANACAADNWASESIRICKLTIKAW